MFLHRIREGIYASIVCLGLTAQGALVFDLNEVLTGTPPSATGPWLRAEIKPADDGDVFLKMEALNLSGTENIKDWAFNINPGLISLLPGATLTRVDGSAGLTTTGISINPDAQKGFAGFSFDFKFEYPTGNDPSTFTDDEWITFRIGLPNNAILTPDDFKYAALPPNLQTTTTWYTAAHVQDTGDGTQSGKIGSSTYREPPEVVVPEPGTVLAGALLLLPFAVSTLRPYWRNRKA